MAAVAFRSLGRSYGVSALVFGWDALTAAMDELDVIRSQVREGRTLERTTRFYEILNRRQIGTTHGSQVATVIELSEGWCIVHWTHDPKSIALYSSIYSLRQALCGDDSVFLLTLTDTSQRSRRARKSPPHSAISLTRPERTLAVMLGHALTNKQMALHLGIAESTVKNTLSRVYQKLDVLDRTQAALMVRDLGLSEPETLQEPLEPNAK